MLDVLLLGALLAACSSGGTGTGTTGPGPGGAGSAGGAGGVGGAGGAGGAAGGGGETAAVICYRGCEASVALGCYQGPIEVCVSECIDSFVVVPKCAPEQAVYQECLLAERTDCTTPPACQAAYEEWELCTTGGCVGVTCMPKNGGCACEGACKDMPVAVECAPTASGATCTCKSNGMTVGTCESDTLACFPSMSCCSPILGL